MIYACSTYLSNMITLYLTHYISWSLYRERVHKLNRNYYKNKTATHSKNSCSLEYSQQNSVCDVAIVTGEEHMEYQNATRNSIVSWFTFTARDPAFSGELRNKLRFSPLDKNETVLFAFRSFSPAFSFSFTISMHNKIFSNRQSSPTYLSIHCACLLSF